MTTAEKKFIRLDNRDFEIGSQTHLDKIDEMHRAETSKLTSQIEQLQGKLDSAEKAVEVAKREKTEAETKSADAEKTHQKDLTARVKSRVKLLMRAIRLFGEEDEAEGEEDEEKKMDALIELSERDIHLKAIKKVDPDFKADGYGDDYIAGKFDGAVKYLAKSNGVDGVVRVLESGPRFDAKDGVGKGAGGGRNEHPVAKARRENAERMRNMAAPPRSAGEGGAR